MKESGHKRGVVSSFGLKTISSLQNSVYRLYFIAMIGQFASMNMQMITSTMLIYRLTGSAALLGTMSLAHAVPMLILSLFGGAIADRVQKRKIIILGLMLSAVISAGIAIALMTGQLAREQEGSWWILMVASTAQGAVMGLMMPARQAIIPEIVSRDQAMNAVALNMMGMNVLSLVAPGVAGFLIDAYDFKAVYFVMAGLNVYGAVLVFFVRHTSRVAAGSGNIMADIREGFRYVRRDMTILLVLAFTLGVVILSMPYSQLLPIFVDDILNVGATGMGVLMSVSGAGALVGSLIMAGLPNKRRGIILLAGSLISGLALVGFSFSAYWSLSLGMIVFVGLGQTIRGTISGALIQTYAKPEYMGRVMSIFMMQWGIVSFCMFIAGLMAEVMPVQWVVGGFALALLVLTLLAAIFSPRIRKLD